MLKKIKTTKTGKCSKCGREIKPAWEAFFDADNKKLYCKPCGNGLLANQENPVVANNSDSVSPSQYDMLLELANRQAEQLAVLNEQVNGLKIHLDNLINRVSRLLETKSTKTATKAKSK